MKFLLDYYLHSDFFEDFNTIINKYYIIICLGITLIQFIPIIENTFEI